MAKILDMTLPLHEGMPTYPGDWHPFFEMHQIGRIEMEHRRSHAVTIGTHTGTHMDSPAHMVLDGFTIDKIPLETIVGEAKVIDFTNKGRGDKITVEEMKNCGVTLEKGDRIIIKTGWYKEWGSNAYYDRWPWITAEAAQYIVDCGVIFLGLDVPSPDDPLSDTGYGKPSPIHDIILQNEVIMVEYLNNTLELPNGTVKMTCLPLKIIGADGCPIRAIAEF